MKLFVLFNIYFPNLNIFNQGIFLIVYSSENNIDCKLLITKTQIKKAAEKLILASYNVPLCPVSVNDKNT